MSAGPASAPPPRVHAVAELGAVALRWHDGSGTPRLTVLAKLSFGWQHGQVVRLLEPTAIPVAERHRDRSLVRSLASPSDRVPLLPRPEVLLVGHACVVGGRAAPALTAQISLGRERVTWRKAVHVLGDRSGGQPAPFSRMELSWERAVRSTRDNPVGVESHERANLVDPTDPARPAGFGPLAAAWPARRALLGGGSRRDVEQEPAQIVKEIDPSYFQAAPSDQWLGELVGDEWLGLDGVDPELARVQTRLPGATVLARVQDGARGVLRVKLEPARLALDTDARGGTLLYLASAVADWTLWSDPLVIFGLAMPGQNPTWADPEDASTLRGVDGLLARPGATPEPRRRPVAEELGATSTVDPDAVRAGAALPFAPGGAPSVASTPSAPTPRAPDETFGSTLFIAPEDAPPMKPLPFAPEAARPELPVAPAPTAPALTAPAPTAPALTAPAPAAPAPDLGSTQYIDPDAIAVGPAVPFRPTAGSPPAPREPSRPVPAALPFGPQGGAAPQPLAPPPTPIRGDSTVVFTTAPQPAPPPSPFTQPAPPAPQGSPFTQPAPPASQGSPFTQPAAQASPFAQRPSSPGIAPPPYAPPPYAPPSFEPPPQGPPSPPEPREGEPPIEPEPPAGPTPRVGEVVPTLSDGPIALATVAWQLKPPQETLVVIAKASFAFVPDGAAAPLEEPELPYGDVFADDDLERSLVHASDFALVKPAVDVLLQGHAYAPGGKSPMMLARLRFGEGAARIERSIAVVGERTWQRALMAVAPTDAQPFDRMPLVWERAFGGPELLANPVGVAHKRAGSRLPNLELPDRMITSPDDSPDPVCFGPVSPLWKARWSRLGTYDMAWMKTRWPYFAADFDPEHFQAAPRGQRVARVEGDESFELVGLHPKHPALRGKLAGLRVRCFAERTAEAGSGFVEILLRIDTVTFLPDEDRVDVVWRGQLDVSDDDAPELARLFATFEPLVGPALTLEEARARYDAALSPAEEPEAEPVRPEPDDAPADEDEEDEGPSVEEIEAQVAAREAEVDAEMRASGIDPDAKPPEMPLPSPEQMADYLREGGATEAEVAELLEALRAPPEDDEPAPPPAVDLRAFVERRVADGESLAGLHLAGANLSDLRLAGLDFGGANLSGATLERCILTEASFEGAQLSGASLLHASAERAIFTGADLTDASFAGACLDGARLDDAEATRAKLSGASLRGASLAQASFAEADFSEAELEGADLTGIDLSDATLTRARLAGARIDDARLYDARAEGAVFDGASLIGSALEGATLRGASLKEIDAPGSVWERCELTEANFQKATLTEASFVRARCLKTRFDGADLTRARLRKAKLDGASFVRANLMEATLDKAKLDLADLRHANLHGASVMKATLRDAKLDGAITTYTLIGRRPLP